MPISTKPGFDGVSQVDVSSQMIRDYQKIVITGRLVYGNVQETKGKLSLNLESAQGFIIDMSKLTFIDSTGLGLLMNLAKQVYAKKKMIIMIVVDEFVRELFMIAKFDQVFCIVQSEQEAINAFSTDSLLSLPIDQY